MTPYEKMQLIKDEQAAAAAAAANNAKKAERSTTTADNPLPQQPSKSSNGVTVLTASKPTPTSTAGIIFTRPKHQPSVTIISRITSDSIFAGGETADDRRAAASALEGSALLAVNGTAVENPRHAAELICAAEREVSLIVTRVVESPRKNEGRNKKGKGGGAKAVTPEKAAAREERLNEVQRRLTEQLLERKKAKRARALDRADELNDPAIVLYDSEDDNDDEEGGRAKKNGKAMVANVVVVDDDDDAGSIWSDANAVENAFGTGTKKVSGENERPGSGVASILMKQSIDTAAATFSAPISDAGSSSAESREEDGSRVQLLPKKKKKKQQVAASSPSGIMQRKSYKSRFGKNRLPSSAGSSVVSMPPLMGLPEDEDEGGKMIDYSYAVDEDDVEEEEVQLMENASKEEPGIANETNKKKSSSKMTSTFKRAFGKKNKSKAKPEISMVESMSLEASPIVSAEDIMNDLDSLNSNSNKGESKDAMDLSDEGGKPPLEELVPREQQERPNNEAAATAPEAVPEEQAKSTLENPTMASASGLTSYIVQSIATNLSRGAYDSVADVAEAIWPTLPPNVDPSPEKLILKDIIKEDGKEEIVVAQQDDDHVLVQDAATMDQDADAAGVTEDGAAQDDDHVLLAKDATDVVDHDADASDVAEEEGEETHYKEEDLLTKKTTELLTPKKKGLLGRFKKSAKSSAMKKQQLQESADTVVSEPDKSFEDEVKAEVDPDQVAGEEAADAIMEGTNDLVDEDDAVSEIEKENTIDSSEVEAPSTVEAQDKKSKGFSMFKKSKRSLAKKQSELEETFETVASDDVVDDSVNDSCMVGSTILDLSKDSVAKSMEATVSASEQEEDNNKADESEKTAQAHNKVDAASIGANDSVKDSESSLKEDDKLVPDQFVEISNTETDAPLTAIKAAKKKSSFLKRFKRKTSNSSKKKQEILEETFLLSDVDDTMMDDQIAVEAASPRADGAQANCPEATDVDGSVNDDFTTGMDFDETSLGIEVHTPSGEKKLFDCVLSPVVFSMSPSVDKLGTAAGVARSGSNNDATVSTAESNSVTSPENNNDTSATPPSTGELPPMPQTPTKIGESWDLTLLFGLEGAPSPSGSVLGATPAVADGKPGLSSPTTVMSRERSDTKFSFECRLEDPTSAVNIFCTETVGANRAVDPKKSELNREKQSTPPPVNRKLFSPDDSFGESLCMSAFQSRVVTTVYQDSETSHCKNMIMESPELQLSHAKQQALVLARRPSRSRVDANNKQ